MWMAFDGLMLFPLLLGTKGRSFSYNVTCFGQEFRGMK